jgi:predicted nucleic acid-binding protein
VPRQDGAAGLQRLLKEYPPVIWWNSPVEVSSALERLRRRGELGLEEYEAAQQRAAMMQTWIEIPPIDELRELAKTCLARHDLRAADALQLAAAITWCRQRPAGRPFLCRDRRLLASARAEGFSIVAL